ncbi:hypothetical protein ACB098_09G011000 [Castanea mollissima]
MCIFPTVLNVEYGLDSNHSIIELKHKLLCKNHELETARMEAEEEIGKDKQKIQQLYQLLDIAFRERNEARDQLQRLQNKLLPTIQDETNPSLLQVLSDQSSIPTKITGTNPMAIESDSNFKARSYNSHDSISTPVNHLLGSVFYPDFTYPSTADSRNHKQPFVQDSSENAIFDRASVMIDSLVRGKPLPQKGKLLQTVLEAGPLLQTILLPPLPQWRNPPPLPDLQVPSNPIQKNDCIIQSSPHLVNSHGYTRITSASISHIPRRYNTLCTAYWSLAFSHLIETNKTHHAQAIKLGSSAVQSSKAILYHSESTAFLDALSATAIIGRFVRQHRYEEAIYLFSRMLVSNVRPNEFTFGTVIHSSTALGSFNIGKQLHACATKIGLHSNVYVGSALLDFYVKLSTIEEAQSTFEDTREPNVVSYTALMGGYLKKKRTEDAFRVFREMPVRNVVSWNAMIGGCSQIGHNEEAVNLLIEMLREGLMPNQSTFPCAISAAANIAALGMGRSFHACAVKFLDKIDVFVGNSLISFYAKCGSMEDSLLVFNKLSERNIVSWNAVICGYAQNGRGEEAVNFFKRMRDVGCKPNSVTLLGLLWACNHAGLIDEGYSYFNQARLEDPSMLKPEHYACMVDLLSRSGSFRQAEEFLCELPFDPGIGFWKALLGGCQIHSNMELGEFAAQKILTLDPEDVASYVMLSNAHSAAGRWQSVSTIRRGMKEKGLKRIPGSSWIEIKSKVHVFDEIYMVLRFCIEHLSEDLPKQFEGDFSNLLHDNSVDHPPVFFR